MVIHFSREIFHGNASRTMFRPVSKRWRVKQNDSNKLDLADFDFTNYVPLQAKMRVNIQK
jgi:hypothetical protein